MYTFYSLPQKQYQVNLRMDDFPLNKDRITMHINYPIIIFKTYNIRNKKTIFCLQLCLTCNSSKHQEECLIVVLIKSSESKSINYKSQQQLDEYFNMYL